MRLVLALLAGVLLVPSTALADDVPTDPLTSLQWALRNTTTPGADMAVRDAWPQSQGDGVTVAVVDTGTDVGHPDAPAIDPRSRNFVAGGDSGAIDDLDGHGTKVSGVIAAPGNGVGAMGVAPRAQVLELRAFAAGGVGDDDAIAAAFDYAGDLGIPVVNASFNGEADSPKIAQAIASHPNTLFVVAAGNDNGADDDAVPTYPCDLPAANVLCVGGSTSADTVATFSNVGARNVDVFAPGLTVLAPVLRSINSYGWMYASGTSIAAANVTGVAALVLGAAPTLTTTELKDALLESGDALPAFASVSATGRRVDAAKAVALALAGPVPPDSDGDGIADGQDATPHGDPPAPVTTSAPAGTPAATTVTPAPTTTATPPALGSVASAVVAMPSLLSFRVQIPRHGRRVTASARTNRSATLALAIERRRCAGRHCSWHRVARRTVAGRRAALARRLSAGRYRASLVVRSAAGTDKPRHRSFTVR